MYADRLRAFRQGLKDTGYVERENVAIEYRWAENQNDRLPELATELVRRQVAVITTGGGPTAPLAAKAATTKIPIVFAVGEDPAANRTGGLRTGRASKVTDAPGMRCRLSPTADVPALASGAAMGQQRKLAAALSL